MSARAWRESAGVGLACVAAACVVIAAFDAHRRSISHRERAAPASLGSATVHSASAQDTSDRLDASTRGVMPAGRRVNGPASAGPQEGLDASRRPSDRLTHALASHDDASSAVNADLRSGASADVNDTAGDEQQGIPSPPILLVPPGAARIEQARAGTRAPATLVASFDGLGVGFAGPQGTATLRNPSDNSVAVGPDHIMQTVNSRMAIFSKKGARFDSTGTVLFGPVPSNHVFRGFGGPCEALNNGDAVVRYDQLANRWLIVMPIFSRVHVRRSAPRVVPDSQRAYAMCYALSVSADPLGAYYRYEFARSLFPDYPRPAVWPDGYYVASSTGDDVIQKHACVVDRVRMLAGAAATEQCVTIDGVNFLNNVDLDGTTLPPPGSPSVMLAAGGAQLHGDFDDDGIYAWTFHVDWKDSSRTRVEGPVKIPVAPYRYLCDGQLSHCVPQPGTARRLDAQGDKLMARVVYRRIGNRESIVAVHSVNSSAGGGGVRWYEFRLDRDRNPRLHQQGTFAPDGLFRWMASPAMDRLGNIGIGYSFGGTPHFPGQRFTGRRAGDPAGQLTLRETVLVEGESSQQNTLRWEDYSQTAVDPSDDCTIWYVGDYLQRGEDYYSTRIGGFRLPGCR